MIHFLLTLAITLHSWSDLEQEILQWRRKNLYMAIIHGKVNISSASSSYDYTAYLCAAGAWSSWHLLPMSPRTEFGSWNNLPERSSWLVWLFCSWCQGIRLAETSSTPRSPVVSGMARAGESCGETLSTTGLRCSRVPTLGGAEPQSGCGGVFAVRWRTDLTLWAGVEHCPKQGARGCVAGCERSPSSPESPAGDARASPTRHSRTRCKTSRDEVTNKMPLAGRAEGTCHQLDTHMCLPGAVSLPHQLPCPGRRGSLGTRHRSFHPATPGTAVPGKMGAAAFKQSSCLFLKQLETAVRSWTHYWAQNNYDKNKFQMGSKGVVFVFTELEWISCLQVPLVFMDRKHELHTIIYYKQKRWLLQQPIYLCSCAFLRFMCCLTHGES